LSAAFTLVRRSVHDAVRITKGANAPKVKHQPLSLADKVRARIEMHGGRADSSQVLPYVGATAAEVKALPGIVATVERSGKTGRPATVFTFRRDSSRHSVAPPATAESEENGEADAPSVVPSEGRRLRLAADTSAPRSVKRSAAPVTVQGTPFRDLL
jgi:hypothetical protein